MCLGIPGQVVDIVDAEQHLAKVDVNGVRRNDQRAAAGRGHLQVGDWVLVHVGFAMAKIDEHEAASDPRPGTEDGRRLRQRDRSVQLVRNRLRQKRLRRMKFVDEFRDPAAARALVKSITELATGDDEFKFMEVCGGHTHTIYRHGIEHLLPETVELVHGPGLSGLRDPDGPGRRRDVAGRAAGRHLHDIRRHDAGARVQGQPARGQGPRRRRAIRLLAAGRAQGRHRQPRPARRVLRRRLRDHRAVHRGDAGAGRALGVKNFTVFCNHVTIVPPIKAILESPDLRLSGFLGPGHVSTVVGIRPYRFVPEVYGKPMVVAGFEPLDILASVHMLLQQIRDGRCEVENQYTRVVRHEGNPAGAEAAGRDVRAAAALRVARTGLHLPERAEGHRRLRRIRRRAAVRDARSPGRRPEGLPVR